MISRQTVSIGLDGDLYTLFFPSVAVGANKVYLDFWNADPSRVVNVAQVIPIVDGSIAVVGTLAVNLFLTRTLSLGTGGTPASVESNALVVTPSICKIDPRSPDWPVLITARAAPAAGALAGPMIGFGSQFTEETALPAYFHNNLVNPQNLYALPLVVPFGGGFRVIQGSVASVGNIAFEILVSIEKA